MSDIVLNPGDMVYYEPNRALGVLISKFEQDGELCWKYSLTSPPPSDLSDFRTSIMTHNEADFIESIKMGRFKYYKSSPGSSAG